MEKQTKAQKMEAGWKTKFEAGWKKLLSREFEMPYFQDILQFLKQEKAAGKIIYPEAGSILNAFQLTPLDQVKVVIIGQDPYHGAGQAHGLAFSVQPGLTLPPSLQNIFKELKSDLGIEKGTNGTLENWARQGLLLLNASLTVESGKAMSHQNIGWSKFTDSVIKKLSTEKKGLIFILWGRFAQQKEALIDTSKHFILKAAHPSPLSAHNGFFGSRPFSKVNKLLTQEGKEPINW
jgi:uracil-DNA glycosylase